MWVKGGRRTVSLDLGFAPQRVVFTGDSIARGLMMNNMAARFSTRFVTWLQQDSGRPIIEVTVSSWNLLSSCGLILNQLLL